MCIEWSLCFQTNGCVCMGPGPIPPPDVSDVFHMPSAPCAECRPGSVRSVQCRSAQCTVCRVHSAECLMPHWQRWCNRMTALLPSHMILRGGLKLLGTVTFANLAINITPMYTASELWRTPQTISREGGGRGKPAPASPLQMEGPKDNSLPANFHPGFQSLGATSTGLHEALHRGLHGIQVDPRS